MEALWRAKRRKIRGGQPTYSDLAITVCLTFGMVNKPPLRQTEGFVRSLFRLMGVDIRAPDFSIFSGRGSGLDLPLKSRSDKAGPIQLVVDSAGLKRYLVKASGCKASIRQRPNANHGASCILGSILSRERSCVQI